MLNKESKVDVYRRRHLMFAEMIDAWRLIPRAVTAGYIWLLTYVILWYMGLEPYMLDGCNVELLKQECMVRAPTTQHTSLITAVIGMGVGIFGFYAKSGRNWGEGVVPWNVPPKKPEKKPEELEMLD
jgi:hypothetical protein